MNVKQGLFIGELSKRVGIPAQTIRYYERLGLVKPAQRTLSQYRVYAEEDELRLQFIQKAKQFGLSLDEIKKLIDIRGRGILPCNILKEMVKQHLDELDRRIEEMLAFRQELNNRYEQIQALLPDVSTLSNEASFHNQICKMIQQ